MRSALRTGKDLQRDEYLIKLGINGLASLPFDDLAVHVTDGRLSAALRAHHLPSIQVIYEGDFRQPEGTRAQPAAGESGRPRPFCLERCHGDERHEAVARA